MNTQRIALDVSKRAACHPTLTIRQGDRNGTTLEVAITDNGVAFDLSDYVVLLCAKLPDGAHYYSAEGTTEGNVATFPIDEAYAAAYVGVTDEAYVDVLYGSEVICSTQSFRLVVEPGAKEGVVPSEEHIAEIDAACARAYEAARQCEDLAHPITDAQIDSIVADTAVTSDNKMTATNLTYFWGKLKTWAAGMFAAITHTHERGDLKGAVWYAVSETAANTGGKTAAIIQPTTGFALERGVVVLVFFHYGNTADSPTLDVQSTGSKSIKCDSTAAGRYEWGAAEFVPFVYNGGSWVIIDGAHATTARYGHTLLTESLIAESSQLALSASAMNTAMQDIVTGAARFSSEEAYAVGDRVRHDTKQYVCTTAHEGAWDAADFEEIAPLQEQIDGLQSGAPIGTIFDYAGSALPSGYLECDGSAVSRTDYPLLWAAIGTAWGAGDGSTTFNLPDFRGRMAIGAGTGTAGGASAHAFASTGGDERYQQHNHTVTSSGGGTTGGESAHTHTTNISHGHGFTQPKIKANQDGTKGSNQYRVSQNGSSSWSAATGGAVTDYSGSKTSGAGTNHTHTTPNHTHTIDNSGSGQAGNMPPFATVRKIIRAA